MSLKPTTITIPLHPTTHQLPSQQRIQAETRVQLPHILTTTNATTSSIQAMPVGLAQSKLFKPTKAHPIHPPTSIVRLPSLPIITTTTTTIPSSFNRRHRRPIRISRSRLRRARRRVQSSSVIVPVQAFIGGEDAAAVLLASPPLPRPAHLLLGRVDAGEEALAGAALADGVVAGAFEFADAFWFWKDVLDVGPRGVDCGMDDDDGND